MALQKLHEGHKMQQHVMLLKTVPAATKPEQGTIRQLQDAVGLPCCSRQRLVAACTQLPLHWPPCGAASPANNDLVDGLQAAAQAAGTENKST
jgi:hypothetical protein